MSPVMVAAFADIDRRIAAIIALLTELQRRIEALEKH